MKLKSHKLALLLVICFFKIQLLSQTYPMGFSQEIVVNMLASPTAMAFAPDGRIFICQQAGELKVVKNGTLLPNPALSLAVNSSGERGLLGIAFDPDFTNNQFIYLYYTNTAPIHNRVSKFKMNGDVVDNTVAEVELLNLETLSATNHNGGGMAFGPDGKLYIVVGDNAVSSNAQLITNRLGKVLRINTDGTIPVDNPISFAGITGTTSGVNQAIWSVGLRNPYTLAFQPGTGILFVNEVGQNAREEINDCTQGGLNYGWPSTEGDFTQSLFPNYTLPIYDYSHGNNTSQGFAITGGTFLNSANTNYPSEYKGSYFFMDFSRNWIDRLTFSAPTLAKISAPLVWTNTTFASGISGSSVGLTTGTDGNLYYLSRGSGSLVRIVSDNVVLPVTLINFKAKAIDNQSIELTWETTSEINSVDFEIFKSNNLSVWEKIGEVIANINSTEKLAYNFFDLKPINGINYYKLKMNDWGAKFNYSNIVLEKFSAANRKITLKPNPTVNEIYLDMPDSETNTIHILNINGKNMGEFIKVSAEEPNKKNINISRLPAGKYIIITKTERLSFVKN